ERSRSAALRSIPTGSDEGVAFASFCRDGEKVELDKYVSRLPAIDFTARRRWAARFGNWREVIRLDAEHPATAIEGRLEVALSLAASGDLEAARARIADLIAPLRERFV